MKVPADPLATLGLNMVPMQAECRLGFFGQLCDMKNVFEWPRGGLLMFVVTSRQLFVTVCVGTVFTWALYLLLGCGNDKFAVLR